MVGTMTKAWYQSKTVWANIIALVVLVLGAPQLAALFGGNPVVIQVIGFLLPVLEVVLRFLTSSAIKGTAQSLKATIVSKAWYQSKVVWANIVGLLVLVLGAPQLAALFGNSAVVLQIIGLVLPILNVVLRFLTSGAITASASS